MKIFTINAGSSSIKFKIFNYYSESINIINGEIKDLKLNSPSIYIEDLSNGKNLQKTIGKLTDNIYINALNLILDLEIIKNHEFDFIINRIVHGGDKFVDITELNDETIKQLSDYNELAPLHQPINLAVAKIFIDKFPQKKHYACFDTGFHHTIPLINQIYAIPWKYTITGIKRYGFHGLSYKFIYSELIRLYDKTLADKKWVIAHLGSGSSICVIKAGKSVACSMGFSTADGLPMATRTGSIDPHVILYLINKFNLSIEEITKIIYNESGLLGISNFSSSIKDLTLSLDENAILAIEYYVQKIAENIVSMIVKVENIEGIIFTGGVGENSVIIREKICQKLKFIGISLDIEKNNLHQKIISDNNSKYKLFVIPTNEEMTMIDELKQNKNKLFEKNI